MNILKTSLVSATLLVAASSAYATDVVDLGELNAGLNTYTETVAAGSFSTNFTFSLADATSGVFSLNQLPLTNAGVKVFDITNLTFNLYSANDTWLAGSVAGGEFSFANLASGNYYLTVAGTANGVAGGIYSGAISIAAVPEPSSVAMLMIGFAALGAVARRRKTKL
ncbi:FxDxF family PEP-CTERM protein [Methylobacillus glycogenes]|uniref:FxDxF family PEP-CTERM protein n=1 Tax=Methylobacillus glycogenes TaxID=406 RepID=UPI000472B082|nr:FxDxF family PEP-CTERM protein [Methylobacillus glycogenes]MBL8506067.1 PEP-CTERM sorting domain-containing protein [Methylobacillus glycogenes]